MKRFSFRFENIFQLKVKQEEQAKIHYGNMAAILHQEEQKLTELCHRQEGYEEEKRRLVSSKLDILKIKECEAAIEQMKYQIKMQKLEVKRAENQVEIARRALNETMVERKTYEKLKEHDFELFKKEYEAEERKQIDELVSYTYSVGGSNGKEERKQSVRQ